MQGDAAALDLPDESVDLIVTSPPYFALRDYKDGADSLDGQIGAEPRPQDFLAALWRCMDEWWRVLKPSGSVWVNLGDKYNSAAGGQHSGTLTGGDAAKRTNGRGSAYATTRTKSLMGLPWRFALGCIDPAVRTAIETPALLTSETDHPQWVLRAEVIWAKPNGLPESVRDRVARKHEQWFHFTKSERYFAAVDLIREPYQCSPEHRLSGHKALAGSARTAATQTGAPTVGGGHALGKLPGSVWTVATEPLRVPDHLTQHFAAFPSEWPRRIILGWAPKGGVILDPFGGTGTTAIVAEALGCVGISNDLSAAYIELAKWRRKDGRLSAKVRARSDQQPRLPLGDAA